MEPTETVSAPEEFDDPEMNDPAFAAAARTEAARWVGRKATDPPFYDSSCGEILWNDLVYIVVTNEIERRLRSRPELFAEADRPDARGARAEALLMEYIACREKDPASADAWLFALRGPAAKST